MTKTSRLHDVMARIYEKRKFTVDELAVEFQVSYRTMLRYLQELSVMGVPLVSEVGKHGGYSLLRNSPPPSKPMDSFQRVVKPATCIVGVELTIPFTAFYMSKVRVPLLWEELLERKQEIRNVKDFSTRIAACSGRSRIYRYIAGFEVSPPAVAPEGMTSLVLPTREYAVYSHSGETSRDEVDETYFYMLEKLRKQKLDHDPDAYVLEVYKGEQSNGPSIYIPLQER